MEKQELIDTINNTFDHDRAMPGLLKQLLLIMVTEQTGGMTAEVQTALAAVDERSNAVLRIAEQAQQSAQAAVEAVEQKYHGVFEAVNPQLGDLYRKGEALTSRVDALEKLSLPPVNG